MGGKLALIQALRGVAALLVVLYHLTTNALEKFGEVFLGGVFFFGGHGVDFFFVLSGFIIYYVHHRDLGDASRIAPYLVKRVVRIYPIYWLVTLAVLPAFFVFPHLGNGYERDATVIVKSMLLLPQHHNPIVTVAWSLVYEVLFYLLFALAIAVGARAAAALGLLWALACALLAGDYLFSLYNLEFMAGIVLAYVVVTRRIRLDVVKMPRFAVLLGDASYSIYLVHSIVIAVLVKVSDAMITIGVLAVLAGVALHLLVERPLLRECRHFIPAGAAPTIRT